MQEPRVENYVRDTSPNTGRIILTAGRSNVKVEETSFQSGQATLSGQLCFPDHVPAPALLICHGLNARGSNGLRLYRRLAEKASENGFVSFVFDSRGVGKSTGEFDYGLGEQEDIRSALNYLSSRSEVFPDRIFIVGHSLGGAVSIYAVRNDKRVKGLVLWSTPKNHSYNVKKFIRRTKGRLGLQLFFIFSYIDKVVNVSKLASLNVYGVNLRPKEVRQKLMKLNEQEAVTKLHSIPILVVIGQADSIVGVDEAQAIYDAANPPKTMLIIEGADHIYKGKEQELIDKTLEWIKDTAKL